MNLAKTIYRVSTTYPKAAGRALLGGGVALFLTLNYFIYRFEAYLKGTEQWDTMWGGVKDQHYIDVMRNAGISPDYLVPARPTFWSVPFTTTAWVVFALTSIVGTFCLIRIMRMVIRARLQNNS